MCANVANQMQVPHHTVPRGIEARPISHSTPAFPTEPTPGGISREPSGESSGFPSRSASTKRRFEMKIWKAAAATIALTAIGSVGAMAQETYDNSDTMQNPPAMAPSTTEPSTTSPSSEGSSTGASGAYSPAGIP